MESAPSDQAAQRALRSVVDLFAASGGVLFEPALTGEPVYKPTASHGIPAELLAGMAIEIRSLLPRWLRVNLTLLPVPDRIGVYDGLPPAEQGVLRTLSSEVAVPLVRENNLIAWASLRGVQDFSHQPTRINQGLAETAVELGTIRHSERERANSEAVVRSNRLSVAGQMAAGIAHEVRNPLAAVRSMVQLVRMESTPLADRHRLLDTVMEEVDRVNQVLARMVTLGRPIDTRDERIDLGTVAADAANFCQAYARQREQTIQTDVPHGLWVQGDPHELRQVLVNLLLNACQASRAGQPVVLDGASHMTVSGALQVCLRVIDLGEGMPAHVLERVFEPFFTTKQDGGGLGLSICREAVQRHGGDMTISSQPQLGTIVSLELPHA